MEGVGRRVFTITLDSVGSRARRLVVGDDGRVGRLNLIFPATVLFGHHIDLGRTGCPGFAANVGRDVAVVGERDHDFCARGKRLRHHQEGVAVFYNDGVQCAGGWLVEVVELKVLRAALIAPSLGGEVEMAGVADALELDALNGLVP